MDDTPHCVNDNPAPLQDKSVDEQIEEYRNRKRQEWRREYQRDYYRRHHDEILQKRKDIYDPVKRKKWTQDYWVRRLEREKQEHTEHTEKENERKETTEMK